MFSFLSEKVTTIRTEEKVICATKGINVVCNSESDCTSLMPCFQEEADGRIFLHVQNMVKLDLQKVMVVSVDSDVVVLAVSVFHEVDMDELWVSYGTGINKKYIPVHEIAASLGPFKARVLPLFHSLTGCDTTSGFKYKGKKSAWDTWNVFPDLTMTLLDIVDNPSGWKNVMPILERFIILLYDRTSDLMNVNELRKSLFMLKNGQIDKLPPTQGALYQHVKRAVYQGSFIWSQILELRPNIPDPNEWGWQKVSGYWLPYWTDLPEVNAACRALLRCKCKKKCSAACSCKNKGLLCTGNCNCRGRCNRS